MALFSSKYALIVTIAITLLAVVLLSSKKLTSFVEPTITTATQVFPESYTELYFENHARLPNRIKKDKKYPVDFTIHNSENKDMQYTVQVYMQWGEDRIEYSNKVVNIRNQESLTLHEDIGPFPETRTKVVVYLVEKSQSISFWMDI